MPAEQRLYVGVFAQAILGVSGTFVDFLEFEGFDP